MNRVKACLLLLFGSLSLCSTTLVYLQCLFVFVWSARNGGTLGAEKKKAPKNEHLNSRINYIDTELVHEDVIQSSMYLDVVSVPIEVFSSAVGSLTGSDSCLHYSTLLFAGWSDVSAKPTAMVIASTRVSDTKVAGQRVRPKTEMITRHVEITIVICH